VTKALGQPFSIMGAQPFKMLKKLTESSNSHDTHYDKLANGMEG
jgi:hypothetical protein